MADVNLQLLFTEEQVEAAAAEILRRAHEGLKKVMEEATEAFYSSTQDYLYQHFDNAESPVRERLVRDLAEGYSEKPNGPHYGPIRDRMWREHRDEIEAALVTDRVKDVIWNVLHGNTSRHAYSRQLWIEALVKVVSANWREFEPLCQGDQATREIIALRKALQEERERADRYRERAEELAEWRAAAAPQDAEVGA